MHEQGPAVPARCALPARKEYSGLACGARVGGARAERAHDYGAGHVRSSDAETLYSTGIRRMETIGLQQRDVD